MLPAIDFGSYSLIIGQYYLCSPVYDIVKQNLIVGPEKAELNISVKETGGFGPAVPVRMYFWGIYPKIQNKPVTVKLI